MYSFLRSDNDPLTHNVVHSHVELFLVAGEIYCLSSDTDIQHIDSPLCGLRAPQRTTRCAAGKEKPAHAPIVQDIGWYRHFVHVEDMGHC